MFVKQTSRWLSFFLIIFCLIKLTYSLSSFHLYTCVCPQQWHMFCIKYAVQMLWTEVQTANTITESSVVKTAVKPSSYDIMYIDVLTLLIQQHVAYIVHWCLCVIRCSRSSLNGSMISFMTSTLNPRWVSFLKTLNVSSKNRCVAYYGQSAS